MIGLIAGSGRIPLEFIKNAKERNVKVVTIGLIGEADSSLEKHSYKVYWEKASNFNKIIGIFKNENVKKIVMLGKFHKQKLLEGFNADKKTLKVLKSLKDYKDITLLSAIINEFKKEGIKILPSTLYLERLVANKGVLTIISPGKSEMEDIKFGFKIAKKLADMDIGQTIIIKNKVVLAVEGLEGTDETIKRGGTLGKGNAVCIKAARTNQDLRMDVPAIGVNTIKMLKKYGISCLAMESKKMLIIDKEKVVKSANKYNICIVVI
ncbi:MAG: UDP-2,3-diacylglucosamine diphosphatase LpxI [Candidatus Firestonebacteria bacterium]